MTPRKSLAPFPPLWLLLLAILPASLSAQSPPEKETGGDFTDTEIRTAPVSFSEPEKEIVIEILVHRWGESEQSQQRFALGFESPPDFVENVRLNTTSVNFAADEWSKPIQLTFTSKLLPEPEDPDASRLQEGELSVSIIPDDQRLKPEKRIFTIPLRYRPPIEIKKPPLGEVLVTTVKEDFTGELWDEDAHVNTHPEPLPLYTCDALWFFFKGRDLEKKFYAQVLDPDGEQIARGTFNPHQESTYGIMKADKGAPGPVYLELRHSNIIDGVAQPRKPGIYTVQIAQFVPDPNGIFGIGEILGDFQDAAKFELLSPTLKYKGIVFEPQRNGETWRGEASVLRGLGSGTSGDITAAWTENGKRVEANLNVNFDIPEEIVWTPDQLIVKGAYTTQAESQSQDHLSLYVVGVSGFYTTPDINRIVTESNGRIQYASSVGGANTAGDNHPRENHGVHQLEFEYTNYLMETRGDPERTSGWHLRDPNTIWALTGLVELKTKQGRARSGQTFFYILYGSEPGEYTGPIPIGDEGNIEGSEDEENADETLADSDSSDANGNDNETGGQAASGRAGTLGTTESGSSAISSRSQGGPVTPERSAGGTPEQNQQLEEALSANDPNRVPPNHPQVAGFIAQWINQAEPPANIDSEVNLRYTEWGTITGQAKGGAITQNYRPDAAAGLTSAEYLWSANRGLDSLHHCRLGEWVMAQLLRSPLQNCATSISRSIVPVPDVIGQFIDRAEETLVSAGLVPMIAIGPPASRPSDEGKIAKQTPSFGQVVNPGETVEIEIFTNYVANVQAPDLVGLGLHEAETNLQENGFLMDLRLGDSAPSRNDENRIQKQDPIRGANIEPGATVTLWVYAPIIEPLVVPSLIGKDIKTALHELSEQDLRGETVAGAPAASQQQSNQIYRQSPNANNEIQPGAAIQLWHYSEYIVPIKIPDLIGLTANEAELLALERGLILRRISGPEAPSLDKAFTIQSQRPSPNTELKPLSEIEVVVYQQPIDDAPAPMPQPKPLPGPQPKPTPAPTPATPPVERSVTGDRISVPADFLGLSLFDASRIAGTVEIAALMNPVSKPITPRPPSGWKQVIEGAINARGVSVLYGTPGIHDSLAFTLIWEESGDDRFHEIVCGAVYESEDFFDSGTHIIGRLTSRNKRAMALFIAPNEHASACRNQLNSLLSQIERFAQPCP